jgi:hypothetical protein
MIFISFALSREDDVQFSGRGKENEVQKKDLERTKNPTLINNYLSNIIHDDERDVETVFGDLGSWR